MPRQKRFSQQDWIDLGLKQLAEVGPGGLTIERVCEAAGRTRGSFYHHFPDHEHFMSSMMRYWKKRDTDDVIAAVESVPKEKTNVLDAIVSELNHRLEGRIRQLSQKEPSVFEVLEQVDTDRIDYIAKLYQQNGNLSRSEAAKAARLEYACYVGAQTLWPDEAPSTLKKLGDAFAAMAEAYFQKQGGAK